MPLREGVTFNEDQLNVIELTDLGVSMDAIGDKIMILVDEYKTGYECKNCGGSGRVKSVVVADATAQCPDCNGKGSLLVVPETARSMPSTGVIVSMGPETNFMKLKENRRRYENYLIQEQAKPMFESESQIAVRQMQNKLDETIVDMKRCVVQVGTRVCFGVHVGTKIPIKGNIKLTIMREHEPLCRIFGSNIADKEILDYGTDPINS